ncbi:fucosyltransferase 2 [Rhynchospora pubera]|uniref:Fucosyltransferase n=1 Tax=Rhynchospora pubera TaxID=906938 RepID=A0AAV8DBV3_9POAL|nr:fucosyltransferase 2 [Rhynchospora pubera]
MDVKMSKSPRRSQEEDDAAEEEKRKTHWRRNLRRSELVLIAIFVSLPAFVFLFGGFGGITATVDIPRPDQPDMALPKGKKEVILSTTPALNLDKLLGGLLPPNLDEQSCQSRYKSYQYRQKSPFTLSPYLTKRLRRYEAYHKKCGPGTRLYKKAMKQLLSGQNVENSQCQYVIWFPCNGLGNRMLTLASTFLYALLTNRVLLAYLGKESENLFCEPFPGSSWVLPSDFPYNQPYNLHLNTPESYVNMLKRGAFAYNSNASSLPAYIYLHLEQFSLRMQNNIFCEEDQKMLRKFNWMLLKSDSYFAPALFLMPSYQEELQKMFPEKESVFHHLGRYLYHPANQVWGRIERYYDAYLAQADEKIGLQIRIFREKPIKFEVMYDQIIRCTNQVNFLPEIAHTEPMRNQSTNSKHKAILITSLYAGYYERIRGIYYDNPTLNGEIVSVYQPSHEEEQQTEAQNHNEKALAEIYLLSFCDKMAISAWSTFGYVAHSFAGIKPWILLRPDWNKEVAEVPCIRSKTVEPCLHSPPLLECRGKDTNAANLVPYVRHCEDVDFGIKLYDS